MSVVVKGGSVTSGSWRVSWRSKGGSEENGVAVDVDVEGTIAGKVSGKAGKPSLSGDWTLDGEAKTDVAGTIPLHFTGSDTETMTIETTSCDVVTGTFLPSFNAQSSGGTSFTGTAEWTGSRE